MTTAQARAAVPQPAKKSSLTAQFVVVMSATLLVPVCTFAATKIYSSWFGAEAVSAVLVFRLGSSLLLAAGSLGMPIALQRTIAFHHRDERQGAGFAVTGLWMAAALMAVACALAIVFAPAIARSMERSQAADLWVAFAALTWAFGLITTLSCIELARGNAALSAITNLNGYGLALLVPLLLFRHADIVKIVYATAAFSVLACIPSFLGVLRWRALTLRLPKQSAGAGPIRTLLGYGAPRTLGNLLDPAFDLLLPTIALLIGGLQSAGYFAAGLALLRPLNPVMSALNMVLIPDSARLAADQDVQKQTARAEVMAQAALYCGCFAATLLAVWGDVVLRLWLGPSFGEGAAYIRVLAFSILPVLLYQATRGLIDGHSHRAFNTANLTIAFAVFAVGAAICKWAGWNVIFLGAVYLGARFVLGALSVRHLFAAHGIHWYGLKPLAAAAAGMAALVISLALRWTLGPRIIPCLLAVLLASAAFLAIASAAKLSWWRSVRGLRR